MSHASSIPDLNAHLDAALQRAGETGTMPGAQAAVVRHGDVVWTGTHGLADRVGEIPVTDETVFCLASLGKTVVATLALTLVGEGMLDLDRPVAALVPEVPGAGVVTPRMLLAHTAGYPDIYETAELAPFFPLEGLVEGGGTAYDPDRPFTWERLLPGFREPVGPGERWEYSNGGYILLTELLVRLTGGPEGFADAWRALAGRAAGDRLSDDVLTMDRAAVRLDRLAHGYEAQPDGALVDVYAAHPARGVPTDLFGLPFGDGLFAGTALGAATFLDALFVRSAVLDEALLDLMTATTPQAAAALAEVPDPALATYGLGTFRMDTESGTWQGHRGTYGGFNVLAMADAEHCHTLAVLTNAMGEKPQAVPVWEALVEALVEEVDAPGVRAGVATG